MHSGVSVRGRREIPDQRAEPSTSACCLTSAPGGKRERERVGNMGGFIVDMKIMMITVVLAGILF